MLTDDETKSYWTPFTGDALEGPLKGASLKQMELKQCRWSEWVRLHPESIVAYGSEQLREGHASGRTPGDTSGGGFLRLLLKPLDKRLPFNELVLGVTIGGQSRAYSLSALDAQPGRDTPNVVLNDTLGKEAIVIFHQRGSWLAAAFDRRLRGRSLRFTLGTDGRFIDSTYHSHWSYEGEAVDGPVAGRKLSYVTSRVEKWYIWAAYYSTTSIYESRPAGNN